MSSVEVAAGIDDVSNRALGEIINERFAALPVEKALVWHFESADEVRIEAVAEFLGLNGPEFRGVDGTPIELLMQGVLLRRRRGTPWALREVLRRLNYGEVELVEQTNVRHNGAIKHNGERLHNGANSWATFIVFLDVASAFTVEEVRIVWDVVDVYKPRRSHFALGFREAGEPTAMYLEKP